MKRINCFSIFVASVALFALIWSVSLLIDSAGIVRIGVSRNKRVSEAGATNTFFCVELVHRHEMVAGIDRADVPAIMSAYDLLDKELTHWMSFVSLLGIILGVLIPIGAYFFQINAVKSEKDTAIRAIDDATAGFERMKQELDRVYRATLLTMSRRVKDLAETTTGDVVGDAVKIVDAVVNLVTFSVESGMFEYLIDAIRAKNKIDNLINEAKCKGAWMEVFNAVHLSENDKRCGFECPTKIKRVDPSAADWITELYRDLK